MMEKINPNNTLSTNDSIIRSALKKTLEKQHAQDKELRIIEELGVKHGSVRIDIAVVNGIIHGYEIKSDRDTLERLPEQMTEFNVVFDQITLVVGKQHLYHAIHIVPDWWGVMVAKENTSNSVIFQTIRKPEQNKTQGGVSIARLLWREEALKILEQRNEANGVRHKPREFIYKKLAEVFESDINALKKQVSSILITREGWRSDPQLMTGGG